MGLKEWNYFTPLRYEKRPFEGPTACCYWSGPRGIAMLPQWMYALRPGQIQVDLYEASEATVAVGDIAVRTTQTGDLPANGRAAIVLHPARPLEFALQLRIPGWTTQAQVKVNGQDGEIRDDLAPDRPRVTRSRSSFSSAFLPAALLLTTTTC